MKDRTSHKPATRDGWPAPTETKAARAMIRAALLPDFANVDAEIDARMDERTIRDIEDATLARLLRGEP